MKPGRELDALVAEKVMGWKWPDDRCPVCGWRFAATQKKGCLPDDCSQRPRPDPIAAEAWPNYSTDIADAWKVVGRLTAKGWCIAVSTGPNGLHSAIAESDGRRKLAMNYPDAPHAVCLVALETVS